MCMHVYNAQLLGLYMHCRAGNWQAGMITEGRLFIEAVEYYTGLWPKNQG